MASAKKDAPEREIQREIQKEIQREIQRESPEYVYMFRIFFILQQKIYPKHVKNKILVIIQLMSKLQHFCFF